MANCTRCGRDIPNGRLCADCYASLRAAAPIATPGHVVVERSSGLQISVTTILVGLNIAVYLAMALSGVSPVSPTSEQLIKWGANFGPLSLGAQPWRLLTSNYVHIGILHIGFNMWCLWSLGKLAERVFPPWTYLFLYTACGLAGSIASLWWHPMVVGAGASGAIFGVAGALIAVFYLGKLPIPQAAIKGTLKSLLMFAGYNLLFGLTAGVDNFAHLGGLLAGLAFGAAVAKHIVSSSEDRQRRQRLGMAGMVIVLLCAGVYERRGQSQATASARLQAADARALQGSMKSFQQGNYDQAIVRLHAAIQENPDAPRPYYLLGLAYMGKKLPDSAIAAFQQALTLKPDYAEAEMGLGMAYSAKGMKQEAEDAYQKASEMQRQAGDKR